MRAAVLLMICAAVAAAGCGRPASTSKPRPTASTGKARSPASMPVPARAGPTVPVWRVVSVAARAARRGLWRDPAPVPPWDWRASEAERKR
jgi:hypothetical protein